MRNLIIIILLLVSSSAFADEMKTSEKWMYGVSVTALVADWSQTRWFAKECNRRYDMYESQYSWYIETNNILNECPSKRSVDNYFMGLVFAQLLLNLNGNEQTRWITNITVFTVHGTATKDNLRLGIQFDW